MRIAKSKIATESDIVTIRQKSRDIAKKLGFSSISQTKIATAVSEIARNAVIYGKGGEVSFSLEEWKGRQAFITEISDQGPGIPNLDAIMQGRINSKRGMGLGIIGSRRILTDMHIESEVGKGTTVKLVQELDNGERKQLTDLKKLSEQLVRDWQSVSPTEVVAQQNAELLETLDSLRSSHNELESLNNKLIMQRNTAEDIAQQLKGVINSVPDIIFVVDRNFEFVRGNSSGEAFFHDHLKKGSAGHNLIETIRKHLAVGEDYLPTSINDVISFRLREQELFLMPRVAVMHDSAGKCSGATVMLADISEFYLLDKMRSDMLGTASHELKTPITGARLAINMLAENNAENLTEQQKELLQIASSEIEKLLRTIYLFLDVIRFKEFENGIQLSPIRPDFIVEEALAEIESILRSGGDQHFECHCPKQLPRVSVEKNRIVYALVNLISNAFKYSPPNALIQLNVTQKDSAIHFEVRDHGPGIPQEHQKKIFERFYRLPGEQKAGTGLGLSIVNDFVRVNGGQVTLDSTVGQGSAFTIILPTSETEKELTIHEAMNQ